MKTHILGFLAAACLVTSARAEPASYISPQEAFDALVSAVEDRDRAALETIMGPEGVDLVVSDSPVESRVTRALFLSLLDEGYRFQREEGGVTLLLGAESWPFPIPIVQTAAGWQFDPEAGRAELRAREIGLNELNVLDLMQAYVGLQTQFRQTDHDGDGVMEFAAAIISSAEDRNGLFWPGGGVVGPALARASATGWSDGETDYAPEPFMGYYFTILVEQGPSAPGGAYSYLVGGDLVAGHALLAVPAEYGETGVHSFLIGENGIAYQADLGAETLATAATIVAYDPGDAWEVVSQF